MELETLLSILARIQGCTFASLDAETTVSPGTKRLVSNERVILFHTKRGSGYEAMVNRRLVEAGLPPSFHVKPLPWGERLDDLPIIVHNGRHYLQTILLHPGEIHVLIGSRRLAPKDVPWLREPKAPHQGLPSDRQVIVQTYLVDNLSAIRLMGEELSKAS